MKCSVYFNDTHEVATPNKMTFFDALYFDYKVIEDGQSYKHSLFIHPKEKVSLSKVVLEIPFSFAAGDKVFCNGIQSWSLSKMYGIDDKIPQIRSIAKRYFKYYGDDHLFEEDKPDLYSWSYGYVKSKNKYSLIGSVAENTAFSLIEYDLTSNVIRLTKLCDNIELEHSFPALDIIFTQGNEEDVFANYFGNMPANDKVKNSSLGWTSWYRYYNKINSENLQKDLHSFAESTNDKAFEKLDRIFQIDDGYQTAIGDWLEPSSNFPNGMAAMASTIRSSKLIPGIWVAPFVCDKHSKIFQQHKNWLLKDEKGQAIKAGYNPLWGGWYYALNIYNSEVRDYLTTVFYTIINKWGYEVIKADFLFAAMISPPKDKTKGQVMHDALTFLEQQIGSRRLLACGVPLGSIFGKTTYCRIGADTHLDWDHSLLKFLRKRERVSTINALRTSINRRHLNKKVFVSDPDVFIMRKEGHKLNPEQQYTILLVQVLFGSQIFSSDDWAKYDDETIDEIIGLIKYLDSNILDVSEPISDFYEVNFKNEKNYMAYINLNGKKVNSEGVNGAIELGPYESIVLSKAK